MSVDSVHTEKRGSVLQVTLDRPKANAIDVATSRALGDVFAGFRDDPDLRIAIITGAGEKFFCPGWDLKAAADGERYEIQAKQGRAVYGVEMKLVDEEGNTLPHGGKAFGELKVRGPWVTRAYFKDENEILDSNGWFATGDVATIDPDGFMHITDRIKDLIKSGGEWISSIELENLAVGHPDVMQAAVIGVPDEKWTERPLLIVKPRDGANPSKEDLLGYFKGKVADWSIPDDVVMVESLPIGGTGKVQKTELRKTYG